jgi:hypothetical protein
MKEDEELEKARELLKEVHEGMQDILFVNKTGKAEMTYQLTKNGYQITIDVLSTDRILNAKDHVDIGCWWRQHE